METIDKFALGVSIAAFGVVSTCALFLGLRNEEDLDRLRAAGPSPNHARRIRTLEQELKELRREFKRERADTERLVDRVDALFSRGRNGLA